MLAVEIYIDMTENEESVFAPSDDEIFTTIWISPRKIFKYIHESHHDKYVVTLLLLSGISRAFDRAALNHRGEHAIRQNSQDRLCVSFTPKPTSCPAQHGSIYVVRHPTKKSACNDA